MMGRGGMVVVSQFGKKFVGGKEIIGEVGGKGRNGRCKWV
jgi:hypothetical protein